MIYSRIDKMLYEVLCTNAACNMSREHFRVQGHLLKDNLYCVECSKSNSFAPVEVSTEKQQEVQESASSSIERSLGLLVGSLDRIASELSERSSPAVGVASWLMLIPDFSELQDERMKRVGRDIFDSMMKVVELKMVEVARLLQEKIAYELSCHPEPTSGVMQNLALGITMNYPFFNQQQLFEAAVVGLKSNH